MFLTVIHLINCVSEKKMKFINILFLIFIIFVITVFQSCEAQLWGVNSLGLGNVPTQPHNGIANFWLSCTSYNCQGRK